MFMKAYEVTRGNKQSFSTFPFPHWIYNVMQQKLLTSANKARRGKACHLPTEKGSAFHGWYTADHGWHSKMKVVKFPALKHHQTVHF